MNNSYSVSNFVKGLDILASSRFMPCVCAMQIIFEIFA